MKKFKLAMIAAAGIAIPATALALYPAGETMQTRSRNLNVQEQALTANALSVASKAAPGVISEAMGNMIINVAPKQANSENPNNQYGELIPVLTEDFSKMTAGSMGNPDMTVRMWLDQVPGDEDYIPWTNMIPEYTNRPNWGGYNVYPAGGMVYMDQTADYAHINTPYDTDLTANDGICVIEFDVTADKEIEGLIIEAADTKNMGPTWAIMGSQYTGVIPAGTNTVSCTFYNGGATTIFNIVPAGMDAMYIDNLTVYTLKQHTATPKLRKHSEYKGTSFRANWEAVEGADSYLVSVYSIASTDPMTPPQPDYILEDAPTTETSLLVDEVESGKTYYYTVKSVKGEYTSLPSQPMRVFDIEVPVMEEPAVSEDQLVYKAFWNEVPEAERYNYMAYKLRTAETDGEFVLAEEDFTGIISPDGFSSDWTFDDPDPESQVYDDFYITTGMQQQGWHAKNGVNYYNSLCIDGFHYFYAGEDSGLISPEFDLSKDGGKATLTITAAGEYMPYENHLITDLAGNPVDLQQEAAVAVFNYDESIADFVQAELIYAHDVNPAGTSNMEMRKFTFPITKGTDRTIIGIYSVGGYGNLYLDDFKLVQNYKAGESFYDPFLFSHWYDGTTIDVKLPGHTFGHAIYDQVQSVRSEASEGGGSPDFAISPFSERKLVFVSTLGVDEFEAESNVAVRLDGGVLTVNAGGNVAVYSVDGKLIDASNRGGEFTCTLPAKGAYIVKADNKTVKVIY